jgi:hypothetical protein
VLECRARRVDGVAALELRIGEQHARLAQLEVEHPDTGGNLRLDERLVHASRGLVAQDVREDVHRGEVRMRAGRNVVANHGKRGITSAAQHCDTLAVLRGLDGVRLVEDVALLDRPQRLGNRPEGLLDDLQCLLGLELAGHHEYGIVRLIILPVEGLQAIDGHALDVLLGANRRAPVAMPEVGGGHDALQQHVDRRVLSRLELVPHHGELTFERLFRDEAVDHAVCLELQRPGNVRV